jgi:hypothetical protein
MVEMAKTWRLRIGVRRAGGYVHKVLPVFLPLRGIGWQADEFAAVIQKVILFARH